MRYRFIDDGYGDAVVCTSFEDCQNKLRDPAIVQGRVYPDELTLLSLGKAMMLKPGKKLKIKLSAISRSGESFGETDWIVEAFR